MTGCFWREGITTTATDTVAAYEGVEKLSRGKDGSLKQKTIAGNLELSAETYSQGG